MHTFTISASDTTIKLKLQKKSINQSINFIHFTFKINPNLPNEKYPIFLSTFTLISKILKLNLNIELNIYIDMSF